MRNPVKTHLDSGKRTEHLRTTKSANASFCLSDWVAMTLPPKEMPALVDPKFLLHPTVQVQHPNQACLFLSCLKSSEGDLFVSR